MRCEIDSSSTPIMCLTRHRHGSVSAWSHFIPHTQRQCQR